MNESSKTTRLKLRKKKTKVSEKCPRWFSNVKVRVILRDWLICEITRAASEYKNNTKGGVEEKNYYLKFKSERDFLPVSFF